MGLAELESGLTYADWFQGFVVVAQSLSCSSDSLRPQGRQYARLPCPSPSPRTCSNSCPLNQGFLLFLRPIFSSIRLFSNESTFYIRLPRYWNFSFTISPSNEYSGLISFRIDWFDLLAAQGTLKSLLQHHSSKASILQHSAFLMVQISHLYMTTGKTITLTRRTFVGKVMSLLFNMLSSLVITLFPGSKCF